MIRLLMIWSAAISGAALNTSVEVEKTEFVLLDTAKYSFEIPKGWNVGSETPWGARDLSPGRGAGKLGAMTAGPTNASWEQLYQTSLYFIQREEPGKPTPFRLGRTKNGYESMSFEVFNRDNFASRKYVLIKDESGNALALSVKIPSKKVEKEYDVYLQRMVDTARIK